MNSFERTLILKSGYDNGWEAVVEESAEQVVLASALHHARAHIVSGIPGLRWGLTVEPSNVHRELERALPSFCLTSRLLGADNENELGLLLEQGARLARTLPDEPSRRFAKVVAEELAVVTSATSATEVERMVRQRVGQNIYRESLMDYWDGACAVTGIAMPELLRASHAKPWSECDSDDERLNVFNGFLLAAHLDALFDRHLMTFSETGDAILSVRIGEEVRQKMGMSIPLKLRWLRDQHRPFLRYHREEFERRKNAEAQEAIRKSG